MSKIAERIAKLSPNRQELLSRLLKRGRIDLSHAVIMPRARHSNLAPLSFAQQRLWLFLQLDPNNVSYNVPEALLLEEPLCVSCLHKSAQLIVGLPQDDIRHQLRAPSPGDRLGHEARYRHSAKSVPRQRSGTTADELEKLAQLLARIDQLSTDETKVLLEGAP